MRCEPGLRRTREVIHHGRRPGAELSCRSNSSAAPRGHRSQGRRIAQASICSSSNAVAYIHSCGGCGIRTHGTSLPTGFQDQVHRPLGQPSRSCESTQPRAAAPRAHTFRSSPPRAVAPKVRARPERVRSSPRSGAEPPPDPEPRAASRDTVGVHRPVGDLSPRPVTIRR